MFGADGLHFDADGNLSVSHGDASLAMGDLSGGERSTALIVTRLLLANSLARASSVWFDEPLSTSIRAGAPRSPRPWSRLSRPGPSGRSW